MHAEKLPISLKLGRTTLVPKELGARDPAKFRPMKVTSGVWDLHTNFQDAEEL